MHTRDDLKPTSPVLVTGATGFTGGALALELKRRGWCVRTIVRDPQKARKLSDSGIECIEGDLRDESVINRAVAGCRFVYHIAAAYRTAGHPDSYYYEVNTEAVRRILEAARKSGVERTVHCSTAGVHGHVSVIPSDENAAFNPGDVYQKSKLKGEEYARAAIASGQPVTVFRPVGIYGPGDTRFLKLFKTIHNGAFRMFGNGAIPYHLTYIDDLVRGILLCGEHPAGEKETFLLCGDSYVTLNELVALVASAVRVPPPRGHLPLWPLLVAAHACEWVCKPLGIDPPLHPRRCEFFLHPRAFTNRKARQLLGFTPRVSLEDGLTRTADWYFEQGLIKAGRGKDARVEIDEPTPGIQLNQTNSK